MKTSQIILKDFKFDSLGLQKAPMWTHVNPCESINGPKGSQLQQRCWVDSVVPDLATKIKHFLVHLIHLKPPPSFIGACPRSCRWYSHSFLYIPQAPKCFKPTILDTAWRLKHMSICLFNWWYKAVAYVFGGLPVFLVFTYEPLLTTISLY